MKDLINSLHIYELVLKRPHYPCAHARLVHSRPVGVPMLNLWRKPWS